MKTMKILIIGLILSMGMGCSSYNAFNDPNIVWGGTTAPMQYWTPAIEQRNALDNMCLGNVV